MGCGTVTGVRIEDLACLELTAHRAQCRAQIDVALRIRRVVAGVRNSERARDRLMVSGTQIVAEEEEFVLKDRTANATSEIVIGEMTKRPSKVRPRIHCIVLNVFKG